jgi:arsenate reductase (thioredoxin)
MVQIKESMEKKKVLFVCVHNSARSQMAEAWLNQLCGDRFVAESAGLEPGILNPLVITAMKEVGLDLSGKETRSVFDVFRSGKIFSYVITVCDESAAEQCPIFPGMAKRLHWSFIDPSTLLGTEHEKLITAREIRDAIRKAVEDFCVKEA